MVCRFILFVILNLVCYVSTWEIWETTKDYLLGERCVDRWLPSDIEGLKKDLEENLFGQPFVEKGLLPLLHHHLAVDSSRQPQKALALSFHGSAGVGKTYVSQLISQRLFKNGPNSRFYKFFSKSDAFTYSVKALTNMIAETVKACDRSIFVFDEIEKMPDGIIDVVKSFIDFHPHINHVDYRKSIFIFISNVGMERVNQLSLSLWKQGVPREEFRLPDFEKALLEPAFNENGGLRGTSVVKNHLIDLYLPFLPLERDHVIKCILAAFNRTFGSVPKQRNPQTQVTLLKNLVKPILDDLIFIPPEEEVYSLAGCKTILQQIVKRRYTHDEL